MHSVIPRFVARVATRRAIVTLWSHLLRPQLSHPCCLNVTPQSLPWMYSLCCRRSLSLRLTWLSALVARFYSGFTGSADESVERPRADKRINCSDFNFSFNEGGLEKRAPSFCGRDFSAALPDYVNIPHQMFRVKSLFDVWLNWNFLTLRLKLALLFVSSGGKHTASTNMKTSPRLQVWTLWFVDEWQHAESGCYRAMIKSSGVCGPRHCFSLLKAWPTCPNTLESLIGRGHRWIFTVCQSCSII